MSKQAGTTNHNVLILYVLIYFDIFIKKYCFNDKNVTIMNKDLSNLENKDEKTDRRE
jgi:hypothetical protein